MPGLTNLPQSYNNCVCSCHTFGFSHVVACCHPTQATTEDEAALKLQTYLLREEMDRLEAESDDDTSGLLVFPEGLQDGPLRTAEDQEESIRQLTEALIEAAEHPRDPSVAPHPGTQFIITLPSTSKDVVSDG